jgi:hypothetical protein
MAISHFGEHPDELAPATAPVHPAKSIASIIAICSGLASFYFSATHRAGLGFGLALLAIICGILGALRAVSPRISGGFLSMSAIVLGVIAILVAIVAALVPG